MPGLPLKGSNVNLDDFHKDAVPNLHQQIRYDLIRRLLNRVPRGGRALDYGCGMGDVTYQVADHFDSIIGVDVTPQRIEWANAHYAPLQFLVCEPNTLAFPDASFDTVLSSVVINWTDSPEVYLANIRRVLARGGRLLIVVRGTEAIRRRLRALRGKKLALAKGFTNIPADQFAQVLGPDFKVIATDCLYEPVEAPLTMPKLIFKMAQFPFKLFRSRKYADYYAVLAQKAD